MKVVRNVLKVENMIRMFEGCKKFNSDLNNWNVSNVRYMRDAFKDCDSMKELPKWYTKH